MSNQLMIPKTAKLIKNSYEHWIDVDGSVYAIEHRNQHSRRIYKKTLDNKCGYKYCSIPYHTKNGLKYKSKRVHRLVAEAFIPNPDGKPFINHRDETHCNNCVDNLEWCTAKYNINYGNCKEKISKAMLGNKNYRLTTAKQIKCIDLETNETTYYPSVNEAARQLMINHTSILNKLRKPSKPNKNRFIFTEINKEKDTLS